jgi:REP element-mobilizing transposase RayT
MPQPHHRRTIRLSGYDYASAGAYFITVCTHDRECLFGQIVNGEMRLNALGEIVRAEWEKTVAIRAEIDLGPYVIMPNHFHGMIWIMDRTGTAHRAPTVVVRAFKSAVGATGRSPLQQMPSPLQMPVASLLP